MAETQEITKEVPVFEKQPTPEQIYQAFAGQVEQQWNAIATSARSKQAHKRGLIKDDGVPTEAGAALLKDVLYEDKPVDLTKPLPLPLLRFLAPLPGDTMRYATYPKGHALEGKPRMAVNKYGFPSAPKARGRKHPHQGRTDLTVKNVAKGIFRKLFAAKAERLEAVCKEEKIEYQGVPESAIPELGAQALKQAAVVVARNARTRRKVARRHQQFSRRVNAGLMPGNTNRRKFAHKGSH